MSHVTRPRWEGAGLRRSTPLRAHGVFITQPISEALPPSPASRRRLPSLGVSYALCASSPRGFRTQGRCDVREGAGKSGEAEGLAGLVGPGV